MLSRTAPYIFMIRILFLLFFAIPHCVFAVSKVCWTSEQDEQLIASIERHAGKSWSIIAEGVAGKINKQCRERYMCHLDQLIDKSPLSAAEILTLELAVQELGTKWGEISKTLFTLPSGKRRTDLQLKNVWHSQHRSEVGGTKSTALHKRHLEEDFTTIPQQVFSALPSISAKRTKKKKKAPQSAITSSVFHSQPPYSAAPLGGPHLFSAAPLILSGQPLLMLSTNAGPTRDSSYSDIFLLPCSSNSVSDQRSLPPTNIVTNETLSGPELAKIFEDGGFW